MTLINYSSEFAKQEPWQVAGSITTAQAALTTAKDYLTVENLAAAVKQVIKPDDGTVAMELRFITDDDADSNIVNLYAMAGDRDYYTLIGILTLTGGTQVAPGTSKVFSDTVAIASKTWPTDIALQNPEDNQIASVIFNTHGYNNFLIIATTLANTLTIHNRRA